MTSRISRSFIKCFRQLPKEARRDAVKAYRFWQINPFHTSLQFKEIEITKTKSFWSVRTELGYRALGIRPTDELIIWHWIGSHGEYDKLIQSRRAKNKPAPK